MCDAVISSHRSIMLTALGNIAWRLGGKIRNLELLSLCTVYAQNACSLFRVWQYFYTHRENQHISQLWLFCCCCFSCLETVVMFIHTPQNSSIWIFFWIAIVWEKAKGNIHSTGSLLLLQWGICLKNIFQVLQKQAHFLSASIPHAGQPSAAY